MERLAQYIQTKLWPDELPQSAAARRALVAARYAFALLRDIATGELNLRAMSLVYTTMLAIVPVLAFSFSVAKGLGFHRQLEPVLERLLEPIGERAEEISASIVGWVDNISGTVLAGVSVMFLLYAALTLAQKVESSFNFVWRVDRPRSLARRLSDYLSVMFVGPLVMIVAMTLIATSITTLAERLSAFGPLGNWVAGLGELLPYLLIVAFFGFLYVVIPNARVRVGPAVWGALFAGIAWATAGLVFAHTIVATGSYQAIYSGFAIVFILMVWLYLQWLILLLGAQLAFYLQNPDYLRLGQRTETMANATRERLALSAMLLVGRDFEKPGHGWRLESLAAELRVPRHLLEPVMAALARANLLTPTAEQRLLPARDLRRIAVKEILGAVRNPVETGQRRHALEWNDTVDALAESIDRAIDTVLAGKTLADLVDEDMRGEPAADPAA